jgi:hypothetical protein
MLLHMLGCLPELREVDHRALRRVGVGLHSFLSKRRVQIGHHGLIAALCRGRAFLDWLGSLDFIWLLEGVLAQFELVVVFLNEV